MDTAKENAAALTIQDHLDTKNELQCRFQNSEVDADVPHQSDNLSGVKHIVPSLRKNEPDMIDLTLSGNIERLEKVGAADNLPIGFAMIKKLRSSRNASDSSTESRKSSDSSIEFTMIEGNPVMKSSPGSPMTSESSSNEGELLTIPMQFTTSDGGTSSEDEKLPVVGHAEQSETNANNTMMDLNFPGTTSPSSDSIITETWTQPPIPSPCLDPCDIVKIIPRPEFPIQVYEGGPPPFSLEAQSRSIRWYHEFYHFAPYPEWLAEPNIQRIKDTLRTHLNRLGYEAESAEVTFLTEGGFHKVYTITALNRETKQQKSFVLRICLPTDPYFKTESDVATTEIVRYTTQVPVPVIYAYDSSSDNALGFEWMLMEKIIGKPMFDYWEKMEYDSKVKFTKLVAEWNTQLASVVSKKIGAIYMRYTATNLQFYVGRCVDSLFTQENRRSYDVYRGPFKTPADFYASVLAVTALDVNDLLCKNRTGQMQDARYQFLDRIWTIKTPLDVEEIKDWQEKREKDLEILSTTIEVLQERLPALCERLLAIDLSTRLSHRDLSLSNVLADENGMPITLLDWEYSELRPLVFLTDLPTFLEGSEMSYEPQPHVMPSWAKLRYSAGKIEVFEAGNKERYLEELNTYTKQKLRPEYQAELRRLASPLQDANWENFGEKLWELYHHIIFLWQDTEHIVKWVEKQFESDFEDDFEEQGEDDEEDEEEDEEDDEGEDEDEDEQEVEDEKWGVEKDNEDKNKPEGGILKVTIKIEMGDEGNEEEMMDVTDGEEAETKNPKGSTRGLIR